MSTPPKNFKAYCIRCYNYTTFIDCVFFGQRSLMCCCGHWFPKSHYEKFTTKELNKWQKFKKFLDEIKGRV
jgi:hypothetical protein